MHLILLSGGSGKRLWPLSNDVRSKQFLKIFRTSSGEYESMVQRVHRQIRAAAPESSITIATGKSQVSSIRNHLGDQVSICVEPARRDTFPAIALAAAHLASVQGVGAEETVAVCPVDPYADDDYFAAIRRLAEAAAGDEANLYLLGVKPSYPSEKYGYIIPENSTAALRKVVSFREKPTAETAKGYMEQGALWNCGVFAFRLGYLLEIARKRFGSCDYQTLYDQYAELEKISFDYAVVEKEQRIACLEYAGMWKDIGTWNTLAEEMAEPSIGPVILDESCENVIAINELNQPMLCMGLRDVVVAASGDGILISDRGASSQIKAYVDRLEHRAMYAEKSWGSLTVLDEQPGSMTIRLQVMAGGQLKYHSHEHRSEVWTVLSGTGEVIVDDVRQAVASGSSIVLPLGCRHTLRAHTEMQLVEVQLGERLLAEDKQVYEWPGA